MDTRRRCPKCSGDMTAGFIVDQGYGAASVSTWQDGRPRKSFWTGIKLSKPDQVAVTTWRCGRCGFLESYALEHDVEGVRSAV